jgi:hypothetical protein
MDTGNWTITRDHRLFPDRYSPTYCSKKVKANAANNVPMKKIIPPYHVSVFSVAPLGPATPKWA